MLCVLLSVSKAYAVRDFLILRNISVQRSLGVEDYPCPKESTPASDSFGNKFVYTRHFRIITGGNPPPSIVNLAERLGRYAEVVWEKEVEDLGFHPPKNSDRYFIDIYIANSEAYNPVDGETVTISPFFAGYATFYPDGTPFFVINPLISDDTLKATLAHEFFHTIQFFYLSTHLENFPQSEMWWLEASSTWMEFVVFPEVRDFLGYVNTWLAESYMDITTFNHSHEYGTSAFLVYLYYNGSPERTVEFVKNSFVRFSDYFHFIDYVKDNVEHYFGKTLSEILTELLFCIHNRETNCFPFLESLNFPPIYSYYDVPNIGIYGAILLETEGRTYQHSRYDELPFMAFRFERNTLGVVLKSAINSTTLENILANTLGQEPLTLNVGWNLVGNPFNNNLANLPESFGNYIVWIFENNRWSAWSNVNYINDILRRMELFNESETIPALSGFWIKLYDNSPVPFFVGKSILRNRVAISSNWKLVTFGRVSVPVTELEKMLRRENSDFILWSYKNGRWSFFSSNPLLNAFVLSYGIEIINEVGNGRGYWIRKFN